MFTLGIPDNQYRRATQVLGPANANPIEYDTIDQEDGFYVFTFNVGFEEFQDIVTLLQNNGVTTIGADDQLTERKIMKLTDLLKENEEFNPMESADDIIDRLKDYLAEWKEKEYKDDVDRWSQYALDIENLVEDYEENKLLDIPDTDIQEEKLRKLTEKCGSLLLEQQKLV